MFCPAKFAPMPSTQFDRAHSSENIPHKKPAISIADTHDTLKTPKTAQSFPDNPKTHSAVFVQKKPTRELPSKYESPLMKNTNYEMTPRCPFCLDQEDIEWLVCLNQEDIEWLDELSADSFEIVDPDWTKNPPILPDW